VIVADEIDVLIEEVIVDTYGDAEQLWAFRQWFEDTAIFPFPATVVGAKVEVLEIDYDGDERRGLVAHCRRNGRQHTISILDVLPTAAITSETANLLAAHRRWANAPPQGPDD
jgi:Calcium binding